MSVSLFMELCVLFRRLHCCHFCWEMWRNTGSAGKTVAGGILTLGGILIGMELLLPAVLGYDRVAAESYPVLPLLAGADLPGKCTGQI